jgi:hypothetical protein
LATIATGVKATTTVNCSSSSIRAGVCGYTPAIAEGPPSRLTPPCAAASRTPSTIPPSCRPARLSRWPLKSFSRLAGEERRRLR